MFFKFFFLPLACPVFFPLSCEHPVLLIVAQLPGFLLTEYSHCKYFKSFSYCQSCLYHILFSVGVKRQRTLFLSVMEILLLIISKLNCLAHLSCPMMPSFWY